jgi:dTDP-4-dehydrorhamnose reductase
MLANNRRILLLGSSGNLGRAIRSIFVKHEVEHIAPGREAFDLSRPESVLSIIVDYKPSFVINCIALNGINNCHANIVSSIRINSILPQVLAAHSRGLEYRLIHFSTECVFNDSDCLIPSSQIPGAPTTTYGCSKLTGEPTIDPDTCAVLRLPLLLSRRPNNQIIWRILNSLIQGEVAKASTDVMSSPVFIDDVASIVAAIVQEDLKFEAPVHISSDTRLSVYDTVKAMANLEKICANKLRPALDAEFPSSQAKPRKLGLKSTNDFLRLSFDAGRNPSLF